MKQVMRHTPIYKNLKLWATNNIGPENTCSPTPFTTVSSPEYLLHRRATSDGDQDGSTQKWRWFQHHETQSARAVKEPSHHSKTAGDLESYQRRLCAHTGEDAK
ncbi:unnamed protein product [Camellia sinensis]